MWGWAVAEERTGQLVRALAEGVKEDLTDIASALDAVRLKVESLGESARAVNGLGGECAGWADHLATVIAEVRREAVEVPSKLLGTPIHEITQTVNQEHANVVSAARKRSS